MSTDGKGTNTGSSARHPNARAAADAFDTHAARYADAWERDPSAARQRARVHVLADEVLARPGARVLDLGCGTGVDAAWLARRGCQVVAVDGSPGMLEVAAATCAGLDVALRRVDLAAPDTLPDGPFDGALSDFGALNCVPLAPVGEALATRLRPGGVFLLVLLGHRAPAETLSLLLAGHPGEAWRRRRVAAVDVDGARVPVFWHRPRDVVRAFPAFELVETRSLALLLPPPRGAGRALHGLLPALDPLDRRLARLPLLRRWGDHVAYVLRRRPITAGGAP